MVLSNLLAKRYMKNKINDLLDSLDDADFNPEDVNEGFDSEDHSKGCFPYLELSYMALELKNLNRLPFLLERIQSIWNFFP